jgi:Tol biopolymer transport system component
MVYTAGGLSEVWQLKKGADKLLQLVNRPGRNLDPAWSDDGERLFFVGESEPGKGDFQLFVWEKSTDKVLPVAEARGVIRSPAWTPLPSAATVRKAIERKVNQNHVE